MNCQPILNTCLTPLYSIVSLLLIAQPAYAVTIGNTSIYSSQNQPLSASIEVSDIVSNNLLVSTAEPSIYQEMGLENKVPVSVRFERTKASEGKIYLSSPQPVTEPFTDVVIVLNDDGVLQPVPKTLLIPLNNNAQAVNANVIANANVQQHTVQQSTTQQPRLITSLPKLTSLNLAPSLASEMESPSVAQNGNQTQIANISNQLLATNIKLGQPIQIRRSVPPALAINNNTTNIVANSTQVNSATKNNSASINDNDIAALNAVVSQTPAISVTASKTNIRSEQADLLVQIPAGKLYKQASSRISAKTNSNTTNSVATPLLAKTIPLSALPKAPALTTVVTDNSNSTDIETILVKAEPKYQPELLANFIPLSALPKAPDFSSQLSDINHSPNIDNHNKQPLVAKQTELVESEINTISSTPLVEKNDDVIKVIGKNQHTDVDHTDIRGIEYISTDVKTDTFETDILTAQNNNNTAHHNLDNTNDSFTPPPHINITDVSESDNVIIQVTRRIVIDKSLHTNIAANVTAGTDILQTLDKDETDGSLSSRNQTDDYNKAVHADSEHTTVKNIQVDDALNDVIDITVDSSSTEELYQKLITDNDLPLTVRIY